MEESKTACRQPRTLARYMAVSASRRRCSGFSVTGPAAALQAARDLDEQLVSGAVPEAVVHQLEAIEIEKEHGESRGVASLGARERHVETIFQERAIGQPRERIVERGLQQLRLR